MFKKAIVLLGVMLATSFSSVSQANAELILNNNSEVWVFKFETGSQGRDLVRQYRKKLGQVVLSKKNWLLVYYFANRIEAGTGQNMEITDVVLLDDDLETIHFKEPISETPMILNIAKRELCVYDMSTNRVSACIN